MGCSKKVILFSHLKSSLGSFLKLLLMLLLPFEEPEDPAEFVGVELADDKFGQPPLPLPLLPTFGDGVLEDAFTSGGNLLVVVVVPPFVVVVDAESDIPADSAISAAAVAASNSSCKFFSYSVCLPCCISSLVKLAASSPREY